MGAALYGILYIVPQFLALIAGYNAAQAGQVTMLSGIPTLILLAAFPVLVRIVDVRLAVGGGLLLYAVSCFMDVGLTSATGGAQFTSSQLVRGVAQFFLMLFLNQAATSTVAIEFAEDASGLFNAARNLGGSIGIALVGALQEDRSRFHAVRLFEGISANSLAGQHVAHQFGLENLARLIEGQGAVMAYADLYFLIGVSLVVAAPLALLLKPLPKGAALSVH